MKVLSFIIWAAWGAIVGRVLLAPAFGLTLSQSLLLLLVAAPAVGLLFFIRWLLRPSAFPRETTHAGNWLS